MKREAQFYESISDDKIKCTLCPHECVLGDGQVGICGVRKNMDQTLYSMNYGDITSISLDPIEKKPLFHFYPSSKIISIGTWGCNLKCKWCQNWQISQFHSESNFLTPEELFEIQLSYSKESIGVAFTYSEPTVFFEYIKDFIKINRGRFKIVLVTNGYINIEPLSEIIDHIDALNIDLKSFDEDQLYKFTLSSLREVKKVIEFVYSRSHLELTTLIVPEVNDDEKNFEMECKWISSISKDIPLHIGRYYPNYKYNLPPTNLKLLKKFYTIAKRYLNYVYVGNAPSLGLEDTYCSYCGTLLIKRTGYDVEFVNYEKGRCLKCGKEIIKNTF